MSKTARTLLIILVSIIIYYGLSKQFKSIMNNIDAYLPNRLLSYILTYLITGIPLFAGTYLINRRINILKSLGIYGSFTKGILFGIIATLPLFLGGLFFYKLNTDLSIARLFAGTFLAGFFEELYFRGFMFGQVFKNTRLGFIPSILFCSILFAVGHIYQSNNTDVQVGIFLITFLGSGFFAWLFTEWNYNLWIAIFLHALMNLAWMIFDMSQHALGGITANILRIITIASAIVITILYKRKKNEKMEINRDTLLITKNSTEQ